MNALQGQIDEGVLANLLQYLALDQASGCLILRHPRGAQGDVFFAGGKVVHVQAPGRSGVLALSELLTWIEGTFHFRSGVAAPQNSIRLSVESLLLEASYQVDEARRSGSDPIDERSVLRSKPLEQHRSTVAMTLRAVHLLRHLDGTLSIAEISNRTGASVEELLVAAKELHRQELVELMTPQVVGRDFIEALERTVIDIMGPIGEIVLDDALYDLGVNAETLPIGAVDELVQALAAQLRREDWRRDFQERIRRLRERFDLAD